MSFLRDTQEEGSCGVRVGGEKRVLITRAVEEVISETYTAEAAITLSHLAKLSKVSCHESVGGIFFLNLELIFNLFATKTGNRIYIKIPGTYIVEV